MIRVRKVERVIARYTGLITNVTQFVTYIVGPGQKANFTRVELNGNFNLVPRVSHLTALCGERGETLVWSGHVLL